MPTYELVYAQEHLAELFHDARSGEEVIIVRQDGKSCELTPLAEVRGEEPSLASFEAPIDPEAASGGLVPV